MILVLVMGIANEASEIAVASQVSISLNANQPPVSASFEQFPSQLQRKWKLFSGEYFELIGTVAKKDWLHVKKVAEQTQTPISKIGYVHYTESEIGRVYLHENNQRHPLHKKGYIHNK